MTSAQLYAPQSYWDLNPTAKNEICNGCGARDGIDVPDTIYGLPIGEACNIHDYMYQTGQTIEDKNKADRAFLNNILRIIEADSINFTLLKALRRYRAMTYYNVVKDYGGPAFWGDKNAENEMQAPTTAPA